MLSFIFNPSVAAVVFFIASLAPFSLHEDEMTLEQEEYAYRITYLQDQQRALQAEKADNQQRLTGLIAKMDSIENEMHVILERYDDLEPHQKQVVNDQLTQELENLDQAYAIQEQAKIEAEDYQQDLKLDQVELAEELAHYDYQLDQVEEKLKAYQQAKKEKEAVLAAIYQSESGFAGAVSADGPFLWPTQGGTLTSYYGMRMHPIFAYPRMHHGIDIGGGGPILATAAGQIQSVGYQGGYGYTIVINHGGGLTSLYGHLQLNSAQVAVGDAVRAGQVIGTMGTTGHSTGVHLHFELRQNGQSLNPLDYL